MTTDTTATRTWWLFRHRRHPRRGWRGGQNYRRPRAWYAAVLGRWTRADLERGAAEAQRLIGLFREWEKSE